METGQREIHNAFVAKMPNVLNAKYSVPQNVERDLIVVSLLSGVMGLYTTRISHCA